MAEIDDNSPWGLDRITCPEFLRNIWEKMRNFETMTWGEILGRHHHAIAVNDLIEPAQNRLEQLEHDDQAELATRSGFGRFDPEKRLSCFGGIPIMKFVHPAYGIHKRVIIRFFYTHVAPLGLSLFVETHVYTPFVPLGLKTSQHKKTTANPHNPCHPRHL